MLFVGLTWVCVGVKIVDDLLEAVVHDSQGWASKKDCSFYLCTYEESFLPGLGKGA